MVGLTAGIHRQPALIPGPLTNVMEDPAVELPLLDGPGISH